MNKNIEILEEIQDEVLKLRSQMIVVKDCLCSKELKNITREDRNNLDVKIVIDNITNIVEDCNTIFTEDIYQ